MFLNFPKLPCIFFYIAATNGRPEKHDRRLWIRTC